MTTAAHMLSQVYIDYATAVSEYRPLVVKAAQAEANYRVLKARFVTRMTAEGSPISKAEYAADADFDVAEACMTYKLSAAIAEAARANLRRLDSAEATARSRFVSERTEDRFATRDGAA